MNWGELQKVWDDFLAFMDKVVQWIQYVFDTDKDKVWPFPDYPDFDAEPKA